MNRRFLTALLILVLILGIFPADVCAVSFGEQTVYTVTDVNPLYNNGEESVQTAQVTVVDVPLKLNALISDFGTEAEAIETIRAAMVARQRSITVLFRSLDSDYTSATRNVFYAAFAHTGQPEEGDYLRWHYGGYSSSILHGSRNSVYYYEVTYTVTYYTTATQETQLDTAVDDLLSSLDLDGKDDYEKFSAIYQYMCTNIVYDNANLDDDTYDLKYTAYAALVNKTAVCQGYANLLYRLLLEVGIDCRLIAGIGNGGAHGWNIVKMGDYYYNVDATWDATWYAAIEDYKYRLRCEENFGDHTRDAEYETTDFHAAYPMASSDYVYNPHIMTAYPAVEATCTTDGNTAYWYCSHCDKYFSDADGSMDLSEGEWIVPAGHSLIAYTSSGASCTESGNFAYWFCETCQKYFMDENAANEYAAGEWIIPAAHDLEEVPYKAPTMTAIGNIDHYKCSICGELYFDAAGQEPATEAEVILPVISISYGDADGDGYVDVYDASLIKKYSVGSITAVYLDLEVLDLDGDNKVDAFDAALIQKFSIGAISKFPVEN